MTERDIDEIRDLLVVAVSRAPEPHGWAEVERRASSVTGSPSAHRHDAVASATGATPEHVAPLDHDTPTRVGWRRRAVVLAVAAAVVAVVAGWLVSSRNAAVEVVPADVPVTSTTSPVVSSPLVAFPTAVPDAPYDPMSGLAIGALVQQEGILGHQNSSEQFVPLDGEFDLPDGVLGDQRILDTMGLGGGFYLILCCDPGPTLWRNGELLPIAATRIQWSDVYVTVDDVGDTFTVSGGGQVGADTTTVSVPGIIDAAATSQRLLALVAGQDPHLLSYDWSVSRGLDDETALERLDVPFADQGPCSIVPVNDDFLVLYGITDGIDRCIGDRAALIDGDTGDLVTSIRLPGTSRQLNAGGEYVTVVTTDGRVLVGRFSVDDPSGRLPPDPSTEPRWTTLVRTGAVAASVGFS